jgi:RNA polymerase sigma-54 factor
MPRLRVHDIYAGALRGHKGGEGHQAMQQRLQEARWFIKNIQQRFDTILRVSRAIVERQKSFFTHGELSSLTEWPWPPRTCWSRSRPG